MANPNNTEFLAEAVKNRLFSRENLNLSGQQIKQVYARAKQLYEAGKYKEAQKAFSTLIFIDRNPLFIFGLASCALMLKDYKTAIDGFLKYSHLVLTDPMPFLYLSAVYEKQKDYVSTLDCLNMIIKRCENNPQYQAIKQRAQMSIVNIKKLQSAQKEEKTKE